MVIVDDESNTGLIHTLTRCVAFFLPKSPGAHTVRQKSDSEKPKWHMVDLKFEARAKHLVPLALLKYIASVSLPSGALDESEVPDILEEVSYLKKKDVAAIQGIFVFPLDESEKANSHVRLIGMDLVTRGRLSVQRVKKAEYEAISLLAERGGWEELDIKKLASHKPANPTKARARPKAPAAKRGKTTKVDDDEVGEDEDDQTGPAGEVEEEAPKPSKGSRGKRKADAGDAVDDAGEGSRRSSRRKVAQAYAEPQTSRGKKRKVT